MLPPRRHELTYQQKMANLRLKAVQRNAAVLEEKAANAKHDLMRTRLKMVRGAQEPRTHDPIAR